MAGWGQAGVCSMMLAEWLTGCGVVWEVPASMSLGHALDWEELAAGERPG